MRITKKWLRDQKRGMHHRIIELCSMGVTGKIADEYYRCFPAAVGSTLPDHTDFHKLRVLLSDLVERAFPSHICD